jgi:hypothetical protein
VKRRDRLQRTSRERHRGWYSLSVLDKRLQNKAEYTRQFAEYNLKGLAEFANETRQMVDSQYDMTNKIIVMLKDFSAIWRIEEQSK